MKKNLANYIMVLVLAWLAWMALTGGGTQEAVAGAAVALLAALVGGRFVKGTPRLRGLPRRAVFAVLYAFRFVWEMVKANLHVALIVLDPRRPVRPGIVKIRTELTQDTAITILANSITLTPGTFTVDVDPERRELYIHCITVASSDLEENTRAIGHRFERILKEVFE